MSEAVVHPFPPIPGVEEFRREAAKADPRPSFRFEDFEDLELVPQRWLVKKILPKRGVGFIAGKYATGKSFLASDLAIRAAAGTEFLGGRVNEPCGVVYVAAEDDDGIRERFIGQRLHYGLRHLPLSVVGRSLNLLETSEVEAFKSELLAVAERYRAAGTPLGLIVFDTLSCCIPGVDENNSQGMSAAFGVLQDLARATDAFVLAVAHFGKSGNEKGIRGWSGMDSNSYATLTLELDETDPDLRLVTVHKVKNGPRGHTVGYRLQPVPLGIFDEDGDEAETCVPVYEDRVGGASRKTPKLTPNAKLVLEALGRCIDENLTHPLPPRRPLPEVRAGGREQHAPRHGVAHGLCGGRRCGRYASPALP